MRRRYAVLAALGLVLGMGIPLLLGGRGLGEVLTQLTWQRIALLLGMIFIGWNLNAGRLRLLAGGMAHHLGQGRALAIIMATEFAICATPGGSGGPLTYAWLLNRSGLPMSRGLALYAVDQLMDMLFFATAVAILLLRWLVAPAQEHLGWQLVALAGLLLGGLGLAWLAARYYRRVMLASGRILRRLRVSPRTRLRLARWASEFRANLRLVRSYSHRRLLAVYFLCVGHWLLRYSILYLALRGLGGAISWSYAFLVQMLSLTAGQATLLPGGSGGTEVSSSLLLVPYVDATTAAGAILVWRFATFYWYLIAGAPVFAVLAGRHLMRRLFWNGAGVTDATAVRKYPRHHRTSD